MSRAAPVRTCVGCRERAAKSDLLRVVVVIAGSSRSVVPDEHANKPGRGAHLHPAPTCLELAVRRRAFPRAFRLEGPLDSTPIGAWLEERTRSISPEIVPSDTTRKRSSGS